ncbi:MAG TPA: LLM class flavin-dependent oxidoreductase [Acidimicrobiales bacterium]|nr:LLM class flavin-dependent oxidoreductase [Acidimicrobiales bacterium]
MSLSYASVEQLKVGLILPSKGRGTGPEVLDAGCATAVDLGWKSVWVTDHLFVPQGPEADAYGCILEATTALAWVGARYETLTLGTSVLVPAMRDAPLLAKQIATIDVLTKGRLIIGVGVSDAYDILEYTNLGKADRFPDRGAYLDEAIALWRHLWSGSTEPFLGRFHRLENFSFAPLPVQGASLPIWCGGRSARALRRSVGLADGWHGAQTGPNDMATRIPDIIAVAETLGRRLPTLSVRCRVKFTEHTAPPYALCGGSKNMVKDMVEFARLGVEHLIVDFEHVDPAGLERDMRRFNSDVVYEVQERLSARQW